MPKRGDIFQSIPVGKVGRTNFNLSHQVTGNFREGICYPIFCEETLPGDSWSINTYNITKLETLIAPAMQRTDANLLWFKTPKRLCMKNFKKWYTGGSDGMSSFEKPYIKLSSIRDYFENLKDQGGFSTSFIEHLTNIMFGPGSVWQMLGLPIPYSFRDGAPAIITPDWWEDDILDQKIDLIPFIAYARIYDEYFRDQSLSESIFIPDEDYPDFNLDWSREVVYNDESALFEGSGVNVFDGGEYAFADVLPLFFSFRRAWRKDYFTSALPTPQRGPEVALDMFKGQSAEVTIPEQDVLFGAQETGDDGALEFRSNGAFGSGNIIGEQNYSNYGTISTSNSTRIEAAAGYMSELKGTADLSGLSPILITAFRNLFKLQAFLEKNNVAGGRFIEFILAHWAERVPDFTVQRPVFVRATSIPVQVSEVTATAQSSSEQGINHFVGDQAGRARAQGNLGSCRIYTQEPSIIIGIYCVTVPPSYIGQGIPKKFQRMTRWDEPYAEFQHIGEQAILNREIFINWNGNSDPDKEFGYQQRYSEFKYLPDRVVGELATNMSYWHQARIFANQPMLNQLFIEQNPSDRIFAVENQSPVLSDFWFEITCSRKLSKFSTPKLN